ncbi:MAG TPA: hypothetical protein VGQ47_04140 [Candidatus Limnocylindrales bacterium]|nr:hypothetical protein [Candidatus Limnocylindrales bacterium]
MTGPPGGPRPVREVGLPQVLLVAATLTVLTLAVSLLTGSLPALARLVAGLPLVAILLVLATVAILAGTIRRRG